MRRNCSGWLMTANSDARLWPLVGPLYTMKCSLVGQEPCHVDCTAFRTTVWQPSSLLSQIGSFWGGSQNCHPCQQQWPCQPHPTYRASLHRHRNRFVSSTKGIAANSRAGMHTSLPLATGPTQIIKNCCVKQVYYPVTIMIGQKIKVVTEA